MSQPWLVLLGPSILELHFDWDQHNHWVGFVPNWRWAWKYELWCRDAMKHVQFTMVIRSSRTQLNTALVRQTALVICWCLESEHVSREDVSEVTNMTDNLTAVTCSGFSSAVLLVQSCWYEMIWSCRSLLLLTLQCLVITVLMVHVSWNC